MRVAQPPALSAARGDAAGRLPDGGRHSRRGGGGYAGDHAADSPRGGDAGADRPRRAGGRGGAADRRAAFLRQYRLHRGGRGSGLRLGWAAGRAAGSGRGNGRGRTAHRGAGSGAEVQHSAQPAAARLPCDGRPAGQRGGGCARLRARRRAARAGAGRSGAARAAGADGERADRAGAADGHLPGAPSDCARAGRGYLQAEVRPPRRESSGARAGDGADRDHGAESRLRGGSGRSGRGRGSDAHQSARQYR